jgi:hypothetical protein
MTPELEQEVHEAITRHLPSTVGDTLRQQLERLGTAEAQLKAKTEELTRAKDDLKFAKAEIAKYEQLRHHLDERAKTLDTREQAVHSRELEVLKREIKCEADVANAKADTTMRMFETVFKNRQVRTEVTRNVAIPVEGCPGGNGYSAYGGSVQNANETETTKVIEE